MSENIFHTGIIKIRVVGSGLLIPTLYSFDRVLNYSPPPVVMLGTNRNEFRILTNFVSQRTMLRLETNNLGDFFNVNRIIIYAKTYSMEQPG